MNGQRAFLVLEDGAVFPGVRLGAGGDALGEVVFTTSMTGYQEVISDPSYRGQIVVMAYPLIGNYGFSIQAWESAGPHVAGLIVREASEIVSHHLSAERLDTFLSRHGVSGLAGVDSRRLVRHLRMHGLQRGVITEAAGEEAVARAGAIPAIHEQDLVAQVSRRTPAVLSGRGPRIAIIDCGVKAGIVDALRRRGCEVVLLPHTVTLEDVRGLTPAGVVVSNGPGDPAVLVPTMRTVAGLLEHYPLMGICLGHQLLALALGGRTYKLKFGHRGSNQPVLELATGRVSITTQNHGYVVDESLPESAEITHVNLNDGTVEGLRHRLRPVFSVQYHPEGRPGPADAEFLYDRFLALVADHAAHPAIAAGVES
ncbi:MAG TPA: glutamine-hydrolyzing carbamoyl-phosphate synthase small subunit [bacterium]|jgi:carbamoyl-phosphate synthase small subunit